MSTILQPGNSPITLKDDEFGNGFQVGYLHFTVENLNGQIIIVEVQPGDLSHAHVYDGPDFSGTGADLKVVTITFQDVNGDGYPDMIIVVDGERSLFINDHVAFRAVTPADKIKGGSL